MTLDEVIRDFQGFWPGTSDPAWVHDKCEPVSRQFTHDVNRNTDRNAVMLSGVRMDGNVILQGHFATLVDGDVYDWTARQFDPKAEVPTVTPLATWRETWRSL